MADVPYDLKIIKRNSPLDRERMKQHVDATLAACEAVLSMWAFYAKKGFEHTLNVSKLLIPENLPSPVVLDATASQNFLWELMGNKVQVHQIKDHPRSYQQVTLHVAYGAGLGKGKMIEKAQDRFPRLLARLQSTLASDRSVLLCTHKAVEHVPLEYQPDFARFAVAHWGAIDGRNDWQDFDAVVLFGLSYRDAIWASNAFIALQGLPDDEWMSNPAWGAYPNVKQEMQVKQLSVSMIQAINRIRCRRVIDSQGNCAPADVFVVLPRNEDGQAILRNIQSDMPNIKVVDWDIEIDAPAVSKVRKGSSHEAILAFMNNADAGELPLSELKRQFDLKQDALKALQKSLKDQAHALTKSLADVGVTYHSSGKGRASKSFLLKR
jgi:broad specificity phosphatase PhoE